MISKETFDKLNKIKGNHRIGIQIPNWGLPQEEYDECIKGRWYPSLWICDADSEGWEHGSIPDWTPDWLYDWLEELGGDNIGELMESVFEFSDIEQLWEVVLLADEVRHG